MNDRIDGLEKDVSTLRTDVAVMRENIMTKADLARFEATLIKYFILGATFLAIVIVAAPALLR